jgi:hypothetical protein
VPAVARNRHGGRRHRPLGLIPHVARDHGPSLRRVFDDIAQFFRLVDVALFASPPKEEVVMSRLHQLYEQQDGAIGYILLWLMGVPAFVLFGIFLLRGCN